LKRRAFVAAGAVVILAVAAVLAVTLWPSSGPSGDGPFGPSSQQTDAVICVGIPGQVVTYSAEIVKNSGSSDATIQRIGYASPHNLRVLQTFTMLVRGLDTDAEHWGYPPQSWLAERTSMIRPGRQYQLVIVTQLIGQAGHADAVLVNYTENGSQYVLRTTTALDVKKQPLHC
jgi:hypothetical protein